MDEAAGNPFRARTLISDFFPKTGPLVAPHQVHGIRLIEAIPSLALPQQPEGDGVLLERKGVEGSLRFADCFPVVVASMAPSPWIALFHSGYKGTVLNIIGENLQNLLTRLGSDSTRTWAWIGPGIEKERYFRKKDEHWTTMGIDSFSPQNICCTENTVFFDLRREIEYQLREAGLGEEQIFSVPMCTKHHFCYSYRKGDLENRLFLLAYLE